MFEHTFFKVLLIVFAIPGAAVCVLIAALIYHCIKDEIHNQREIKRLNVEFKSNIKPKARKIENLKNFN